MPATPNLANNPAYQAAFQSNVHPGLILYTPIETTEYHVSRYIAAGAQEIYSSCGATKELTGKMYEAVKRICDEAHQDKNLQGYMEINTLMDNLLYRHQYPVDEQCALRMGAILTFLGDENPDTVLEGYTRRKISFALGDPITGLGSDPELYAFFLSLGVLHTPAYTNLLTTLVGSDYLERRTIALQSLLPARLIPNLSPNG